MSVKMAGCPDCGEPVVATFRFPGKEFICFGCGGPFDFLQPVHIDAAPELVARRADYEHRLTATPAAQPALGTTGDEAQREETSK